MYGKSNFMLGRLTKLFILLLLIWDIPNSAIAREVADKCADFIGDIQGPASSSLTTTVGPFCVVSATSEESTASTNEMTDDGDTAYRKKQQYRFVKITKDNLAKDMARGGGGYVTAMAYLQGCPVEVHNDYAGMLQHNFS